MATRKTTSRTTKPVTSAELDSMGEEFEALPALMTATDLSEIDRMLDSAEGRITLRAGLLMLTQSGRELLDLMRGAPELVSAYAELAECAKGQARGLRGIADALDTASTRLALALCDSPQPAAS